MRKQKNVLQIEKLIFALLTILFMQNAVGKSRLCADPTFFDLSHERQVEFCTECATSLTTAYKAYKAKIASYMGRPSKDGLCSERTSADKASIENAKGNIESASDNCSETCGSGDEEFVKSCDAVLGLDMETLKYTKFAESHESCDPKKVADEPKGKKDKRNPSRAVLTDHLYSNVAFNKAIENQMNNNPCNIPTILTGKGM